MEVGPSMDSSKSAQRDKDHRRSHRSRPSPDSEEERHRRRRRKEREDADLKKSHSGRHDERDVDLGDKYDGRGKKRRRSRSPAYESSRRREDDQDSKHRNRRDRSPEYRSTRDDTDKPSRESSATQISRKSKGPLPSQELSFLQNKGGASAVVTAGDKEVLEKEKPNFAPTGLLAAASNSVAKTDGTSIALKYHEPPESRKPPPKDEWKLFVFKGADIIETIDLSTRSCWLVGRELAVADMPAEHPSISKQHAVIQFRYLEKTNEYGDRLGKVRPYLIDLESANGTSLNKEGVPASRYLELRDKDMIQFGHSTREYVLMLSTED